MKRYTVAPAARDDLDAIWDYIAVDNPEAADRLMDMFSERFSLLASQPLMGQARPDLAPLVRHSVVGSHLIFYRPRESGVEVLRVLRGSRDVPTVFRRQGDSEAAAPGRTCRRIQILQE